MEEIKVINNNQVAIKDTFETIIAEQGVDNLVYKMKKKDKVLVSYNKNALTRLCLELGLIQDYTEMNIAPLEGGHYVVSVKLTLKDLQNNVWATAYGGYDTQETKNWKINPNDGGLRGIPIAQKRALSNALTPILIKLGLDYASVIDVKDDKTNYEHTSNVEDVAQLEKAQAQDERINNESINELWTNVLKNTDIEKELFAILESKYGFKELQQGSTTLAMVQCLKQTDFELIKANYKLAKGVKK